MYTAFENISDSARIWIYQADRHLNQEETAFIDKNLQVFLEKWTAHGNDLFASAKIEFGLFLVIALDEKVNQASGCSIDASVHFINELEKHLKVGFFNRTLVAIEGENSIDLFPMNEMAGLIELGKVDENSITFNNLVGFKRDLENSWRIPASSSWLKKYFKKKNTAV